jgi:hypothetical protein
MLYRPVHSHFLRFQVYLLTSAADCRGSDPPLQSVCDAVHSTVYIEARNVRPFRARRHIRINHCPLCQLSEHIHSVWENQCGVELVLVLSDDPGHHTESWCGVPGQETLSSFDRPLCIDHYPGFQSNKRGFWTFEMDKASYPGCVPVCSLCTHHGLFN